MKSEGKKAIYYLVQEEAVPEVFKKVILAQELLATQQAKDVSQAVRMAGISRSVYYKYYRMVQLLTSANPHRKVSIRMTLKNVPGSLSETLEVIKDQDLSILTIFQGLPIHTVAAVDMMLDFSQASVTVDQLLASLKACQHVISVDLQGLE